MNNSKPGLFSRHKLGLALSMVTFIGILIALNVYDAFRSSFEAGMATKQVEDSVVTYSLVQRLLYGDLGHGVIWIVGLGMIVIFLIPTIKDAVKPSK